MNIPVVVAYFLHFMGLGLVWVPMYQHLTERLAAQSGFLAIALGVGSLVAFLLLRKIQMQVSQNVLVVVAEGSLTAWILMIKRELAQSEISDLQPLVALFFVTGLSQSVAFAILQSAVFRVRRVHPFRLRAIGTLGFAAGTAVHLLLKHQEAVGLSVYVFFLATVVLLVSFRTIPSTHSESSSESRVHHRLLIPVLALAMMGSLLESFNGQLSQKWLTESSEYSTSIKLILTGLLFEAIFLVACAPFLPERYLVPIGFIGWFGVFIGFACGISILSICSFLNCSLAFSLAGILSRTNKASTQALLCVMSATGGYVASLVIIACRALSAEPSLAYVATLVAAIAILLSLVHLPKSYATETSTTGS